MVKLGSVRRTQRPCPGIRRLQMPLNSPVSLAKLLQELRNTLHGVGIGWAMSLGPEAEQTLDTTLRFEFKHRPRTDFKAPLHTLFRTK